MTITVGAIALLIGFAVGVLWERRASSRHTRELALAHRSASRVNVALTVQIAEQSRLNEKLRREADNWRTAYSGTVDRLRNAMSTGVKLAPPVKRVKREEPEPEHDRNPYEGYRL